MLFTKAFSTAPWYACVYLRLRSLIKGEFGSSMALIYNFYGMLVVECKGMLLKKVSLNQSTPR